MTGAVSDSFSCVSVHLGAGARFTCHTYPHTGPILSVDAGDVSLRLHIRHEAVDATDVANAKALADAVAVYLAECERIHHQTHPTTGTDTDTGSAEVGRGDAADPAGDAAA